MIVANIVAILASVLLFTVLVSCMVFVIYKLVCEEKEDNHKNNELAKKLLCPHCGERYTEWLGGSWGYDSEPAITFGGLIFTCSSCNKDGYIHQHLIELDGSDCKVHKTLDDAVSQPNA